METILEIHSVERMNKLKDKCQVMSVLLNRSCGYYNRIKRVIQLPLVFISSALVVVNSYFRDSEKHLREVNIGLNASNIFFIALLNNLKIVEKTENFKTKAFEFFELAHSIENEVFDNNIENEKIKSYQEKYDMVMKSTLLDEIPEHIKNKVKNEFESHHLPLILGRISPNCSET